MGEKIGERGMEMGVERIDTMVGRDREDGDDV